MKWHCIIIMFLLTAFSCAQSTDAERFYGEGLERYQRNDLTGAEESLKKCLERNEDHAKARIILSKIYYFQKNDDLFKKNIEVYLKENKNNIEGLLLKARWEIGKRMFNEAKETLKKLLEISEYDAGGLYLLGTVYTMEKNYTEAMVTFNKAFSNYMYYRRMHEKLDSIYDTLGLNERSENNKKMVQTLHQWEETQNEN